MQSTLSELFVSEHDFIMDGGDIIVRHGNLWRSDPAGYEHLVKQMLGFFSVYADRFHHFKEEEILFPAISAKNETTGAGMVQELTEHHEEFRMLMKQIREALDKKEFASAQQLLENYIHQLKDHIAVENDELFPMADELFSKDELDKLYYQCIDKDRELGSVQKEELESLIKNLTSHDTVQ